MLIYISNQWYQAGEIGGDFRQEDLEISDIEFSTFRIVIMKIQVLKFH